MTKKKGIIAIIVVILILFQVHTIGTRNQMKLKRMITHWELLQGAI